MTVTSFGDPMPSSLSPTPTVSGRPQPTAGRARLTCVDATRGLAVLGLMAAHILVFSQPMSLVSMTTGGLEQVGANATFTWMINVFVLGKFMFLFALLFGASVIFFDGKTAGGSLTTGARLWYRRMGWLAVIGLLHGVTLFFGDILLGYAICGLGALWWMRRLRPWILLTIGAAMYLVIALLLVLMMAFLMYFADEFMSGAGGADQPPPADIAMHIEGEVEETPRERDDLAEAHVGEPADNIDSGSAGFSLDGNMGLFGSVLTEERQVELVRGSYLDASKVRLALWVNNLINLPFFTVWLATGIMLIGMGLARLGVVTGERSTRFYVIMLVVGLAIGVPASVAGYAWVMEEPDMRGLVWMGMFQLLGVPTSFAYLAAVVLMGRVAMFRPIETALAAVGRMALSNYLLHSLIGAVLFQGWGLGWFAAMEFPALAWIVLAVWTGNIAFSLLWLKAFRFGPMEWVWRSLTYGRCQPMRRGAAASELAGRRDAS